MPWVYRSLVKPGRPGRRRWVTEEEMLQDGLSPVEHMSPGEQRVEEEYRKQKAEGRPGTKEKYD
jgi:hypothetical protein